MNSVLPLVALQGDEKRSPQDARHQPSFGFLPDRLIDSQRQANDPAESGDGFRLSAAAGSFRRARAEPTSMAERADDLREGLRDLLGRGGEAELPIDLGQ